MKMNLKTIAMALTAVFLWAGSVHAEEVPEVLTQGEAALMLANKMKLGFELDHPLTAMKAISMLQELGIAPFGGWQIDEPMMEHDLARILVFALGHQNDIPEEERNNPETTAFRDLLIREYNLDLSSLRAALSATDPKTDGRLSTGISTDPVTGQLGGGEVHGLDGLKIPVSQAMLSSAFDEVIQSPGDGSTGRPGGGTSTTPSAPAP